MSPTIRRLAAVLLLWAPAAATPGLRSAGKVSVYGYVQVPVYEHVNETKLAPRYGLQLGVSAMF